MKVLILGGTRFMGPYVVRRLSALGHDLTIFHRGETETELPPSVDHVHGDFARFADYVKALRARSPEVVLDMVPFREEDAQRLLAFKGVARRVVTLSSCDVYRAFGRLTRTEAGEPDPTPLTEASPLRERLSDAGLSYNKTAVERLTMSEPELPATILRLPAIHGPGDSQHRLFGYLKRMEDRRPAILIDQTVANWHWMRGYVEDVAEAVALAVTNETAAGRIYNVVEPEAFSEWDWIREIAKVVGWPGEIVALPPEQLPEKMRGKADYRQDMVVDSSRIRRELGYAEIVPHAEALRRSIDWERANPPTINPDDFDYQLEDRVLATL
jgi:nucleoside-diphosphate-sugar epimerase